MNKYHQILLDRNDLQYISRKRNNLTMDTSQSSWSECVYLFSTLRKQTRTHFINGDSN